MSLSTPTLRRRWRRLAIGFAVSLLFLVALGPPYGLRRDRNTFQCQTCLSKRHEFQWRVGKWSDASLPVSGKRTVVEESQTFRRFVSQPHNHEWRFAQGSPYYWLGTTWGGCALGPGRHRSELADVLERPFEGFDDFVANKLKSGQLTTNQLYDALLSPRALGQTTISSTASQRLAHELSDEFFNQATAHCPLPTDH